MIMSKNTKRLWAWVGAAAVGIPALLVLTVWIRPPELIRIGANYTAKIVCSNVFLAGRDAQEVLKVDVQAPGHPLLKLMRVSVDRSRGVVRAGLFGFIGAGLAQVRPEVGCAALPDGKLDASAVVQASSVGRPSAVAATAGPGGLWPEGEGVQSDPALQRLIADDALAGPGMRAIVVIHGGRIVAERYADGFSAATPQLGWSMTKTVTAGLIALLVKDGRLALTGPAGWPGHDGRDKITIANLMSMSSGLRFNEGYGAVSDVTRMLYLEPDMADFAHKQPLQHPVGDVWSYSSGAAVILSRLIQDAVGADAASMARRRLFDPLGMTSAIIETDEHGTMVGSSYMYATPRDWARYGELLAQDGMWRGQEVLPRGYVAMMSAPVPASGGEYGQGLVWRWASHGTTPGENPDARYGIPADTFWMTGHDGQYVAIVPSRALVVVRMGLTPARENYLPQPLVAALLNAIAQ
jgi:CubicO group peptidase (beta-lactamase class C family)